MRPRWGALLGSVLAGVVVGTWLWSGGSRNSLAEDVLSHIEAEPAALSARSDGVQDAAVHAILGPAGARMDPAVGPVLHARSCEFRGRTVPHLVVRVEGAPVTLLVLRDEPVPDSMSFARGRFSGTIVPSGPGSLAVVAGPGGDAERAALRLQAALEW